MIHKLRLDIETYCDLDLSKVGIYKYFQHPSFQILMIAYAYDDSRIRIVDMAAGEEIPKLLKSDIQNKHIIKTAHNAAFERMAFNTIGLTTETSEWECTLVKAAYCGLPLSLDKVCEALKISADKAKLKIGKDLIKYFCKPNPKNHKKRRNLYTDDLDKWELFKTYCKQDVAAEREVANILSVYTIPEFEKKLYILDQKINDKGVMLDIPFATTALEVYAKRKHLLLEQMKELTGLEKPNSPASLSKWLSICLQKPVKSVAKDKVAVLLKEAGAGAVGIKVRKVLALRKKLSKSSISKYKAMLECVGTDLRARGLIQFYGASRTGRWAGRLIQVQNLTRNYVKPLAETKALVATGDSELLGMLYADIPSILSQLIRTAFIAKENHTFAVADFSAIEARVLAWIANEKWRLDVFNTHGKIYEASAAKIFNIPFESITKGSEYRDRGKVAELALGYQGSVGAMRKMDNAGKLKNLSDESVKNIVTTWRSENPAITSFWKRTERNAKKAIATKNVEIKDANSDLIFLHDGNCLMITLPSKRKLFYYKARFGEGKYGRIVKYLGVDAETKRFVWIESYGGKFTENIVQAIARDLLAESMIALDSAGYPIVMHVHDEAICEIPKEGSEAALDEMCSIMGLPIAWAKGLPLNADGYLTQFYKKD